MTLKHVLKLFSKTEVQEDKTHPCHLSQTILNRLFGRVLEREGVSISCAEHTVKNLSSHRPIVLTTLKKAAFTLAEVLITLAVIGVVAALTLPTLIQNYNKQTYVNGLKKAISTTSNMFKKMQADEEASSLADTKLFTDGRVIHQEEHLIGCTGDIEIFECYLMNPSVFRDVIPKYIKVVKICEGSQCDIRYTTTRLMYEPGPGRYGLQSMNKERISSIFGSDVPMLGFYTADGMIFYMVQSRSYFGITVVVDVNGEKGPNIMNRDLLGFSVSSQGKIIPVLDMYHLKMPFDIIIQNGWVMDY